MNVRLFLAVSLVVATPLPPPMVAQACPGDCNLNGAVTIDELVLGVNIALGTIDAVRCREFDRDRNGRMTIDELAVGVSASIDGCPSGVPIVPLYPPPLDGTITGVVPFDGTTLEIPAVCTLQFPSGSFADDQMVAVAATAAEDTAYDFDVSAGPFHPKSRLYEIRINTGIPCPATSLELVVSIPPDYSASMPLGHSLEAFAQIWQDGGLEVLDHFEPLPATFDVDSGQLRVTLVSETFTRNRLPNGACEAIVVVAQIPEEEALPLASPLLGIEEPCPMILCPPLDGDLDDRAARSNRPFNRAAQHFGTDYDTDDTGDEVRAAAEGTVEIVNVQRCRKAHIEKGLCEKLGSPRGWGQYVLIRHAGGSATLYGHLKIGSPVVTGHVNRGDVIAEADNSGTSTGSHLHLELIRTGLPGMNANNQDPDRCIPRDDPTCTSCDPSDIRIQKWLCCAPGANGMPPLFTDGLCGLCVCGDCQRVSGCQLLGMESCPSGNVFECDPTFCGGRVSCP